MFQPRPSSQRPKSVDSAWSISDLSTSKHASVPQDSTFLVTSIESSPSVPPSCQPLTRPSSLEAALDQSRSIGPFTKDSTSKADIFLKRGLHERSQNISATSVVEREHGVSSFVHAHRSLYPASSCYFVTLVPPVNYPVPPGTDPSTHQRLRRGALLPLYPTLGGQLWAIAREYGLPSIGGLQVFFAEDGEGNLGPKISDSAWHALWSRFFQQDDSSNPSPNLEFPTPPLSKRFDANQQNESFLPSNASDLSRYSEADVLAKARIQPSTNRPSPKMATSSSLQRKEASSEWSPSARSMAWSGQGSSRLMDRSSFKLPIVGKIEWMVDEQKAIWWDAWCERKSAPCQPKPPNHRARRSLHLAQDVASQLSPQHKQTGQNSASARSSLASHRSSTLGRQVDTETAEALHFTPEPISIQGRNSLIKDFEPESSLHEPLIPVSRDSGSLVGNPISPRASTQLHLLSSGGLAAVAVKSETAKSRRHSYRSVAGDSYTGYSALLDDTDARNEDASEALASSEVGESSNGADHVSRYSQLDIAAAFQTHFDTSSRALLDGHDEDMWRELQTPQQRSSDSHSSDIQVSQSDLPNFTDNFAAATAMEMQDGLGPSPASLVLDQTPPLRLSSRTRSPKNLQGPKSDSLHSEVPVESLVDPLHMDRNLEVDLNEQEAQGLDMTFQSDIHEVVSLWASKVVLSSEAFPQIEPPLHHHHHQAASTLEETTPLFGGDLVPSVEMETESHPDPWSLLSPIALETASFSGPRSKLEGLGANSPHSKLEEFETDSPQSNYSTFADNDQGIPSFPQTSSEPVVATSEAPTTVSPDPRPSPSSLELPKPSKSSLSRRSSAELSDSLEQMQKALELLSPAHSPRPGSALSLDGRKMSSRDSLAFAKTLSASVTPSPRWFSKAKTRQSKGEGSFSSFSTPKSKAKSCTRPASASATMTSSASRKHDVHVPLSASHLAQFNPIAEKDMAATGRFGLDVELPSLEKEGNNKPSGVESTPVTDSKPASEDSVDQAHSSETLKQVKLVFDGDTTAGFEADCETAKSDRSSQYAAFIDRTPPQLTNGGSLYVPHPGDIEALSGDPEEGIASIERFLRGNLFVASIQSEQVNSTLMMDDDATARPVVEVEVEQVPPLDTKPKDPTRRSTQTPLLQPGDTEPRAQDRWSHGSHSQSNWTGVSGHSRQSSSIELGREPGTPIFIFEGQDAGHSLNDGALLKEAAHVESPYPSSDYDESFTGTIKCEKSMIDDASLEGRETSREEAAIKSSPVLPESDLHAFGSNKVEHMLDDDDKTNDGEILETNRDARVAAGEALFFASSPHDTRLSLTQSSQSLSHMSMVPISPTSPSSIVSGGRRRASGSSVGGSKRRPPLLNLDVDPALRGSPGSRISPVFSPRQRFRALPPSPSLHPQYRNATSPLGATFPSSALSDSGSPSLSRMTPSNLQ